MKVIRTYKIILWISLNILTEEAEEVEDFLGALVLTVLGYGLDSFPL